MDFKLYSEIVLVRDVPEEGFYAGDISTIIERQLIRHHT